MNSTFKNKKILILGLGRSGGGVGAAKFFAARGARVTVSDLLSEKHLSSSLQKLKGVPITYSLGGHTERDLDGCDLVVRNPSVSRDSRYLLLARKRGIPIEMAESLFMKLSPTRNIIGVTGTRGKSTTSSMVYHALKRAEYDVVLGGNVKGVSTLSLLDQIDKRSWVVLELSSWQLQSFDWYKYSPHIAAVTNIYPDHLNTYASMEEYIADKKNIFLHQKKSDSLVLNSTNSYTKRFADEAKASVYWFAKNDWPEKNQLKLLGDHNRENASCALCIAVLAGVHKKTAISAIKRFRPLAGRLETIRTVNDVKFINDTTSTTPIAGVKAIQACKKHKIILIAGGNTKNIPLDNFINEIRRNVRFTVLFSGSALHEFKGLSAASSPVALTDMKRAVQLAAKKARPGDVVLFSPGTTHLPVKNEFERGDDFVREVKAL